MSWVNKNLNACVFAVGCSLLYVGLWHWSIGAANVALGALAIVVAAHPYVLKLWRS